MAITDQTIYIIHKKRVKSTVKIVDLLGMTKTMPKGTEFGIHLAQSHVLEMPTEISTIPAFAQATFSAGVRPVIVYFSED